MEALSAAKDSHRFQVLAHVIMPEHAHLLVRPLAQDYDVALILKAIKQSVSRKAKHFLRENNPDWLKRLTVTRGNREVFRFWQTGPGYDRNIRDEDELLEKVIYIHFNPVRRGLVSSPEKWKWSSAKEYSEDQKQGR